MNMSNHSNAISWQPLNFQDLSASELSQLTKPIHELDIVELDSLAEVEAEPAVMQVDPLEIERELENIRQQTKEQAYQEGFNLGKQEGINVGHQAGYEQGYQLGQQEGRAQIEEQLNDEKLNAVKSISNLVTNFQRAIDDIDALIVPKLFDLALVAAEKTVGSITKVRQKQLMQTIKALVQECSMLSKPLSLHLNPSDLQWLEPLLNEQINQNEWQIVPDASIEPGGCKVFTDTNEIDACIAEQWQIMSECIHGDKQ